MHHPKTKIVVSLGPVSEKPVMLTKLLRAGMNVCRLNFSHGDAEEHQGRLKNLREASKKTSIPVAVLQDLGGPKIRTGEFENGEVILKKGETLTFVSEKILGTKNRCFLSYTDLWKEVKKGQVIYLDDGKKSLQVVTIGKNEVTCKILSGGLIRNRRGVNIPGVRLKKVTALTEKDKKDVLFGIENKLDYIALSFVQDAQDIEDLRVVLDRKKSSAKIIAKIETSSAIQHIDEIIQSADGIMVARGDLAVEIPAEEVPLIQKEIIAKCNQAGKPVIVATQMLLSMVSSPRPSRAEVNDIANSILDGADAIMLSDETTIGEYPEESVLMMKSIADHIEKNLTPKEYLRRTDYCNINDAISHSALEVAEEVHARFIIAFTESGRTANMISRFRPRQPILTFSPNEQTRTQTLLSFGCFAYESPSYKNIEEVIKFIREFLITKRLAKKGEAFVLVAGIPFGQTGATNMILAKKV
ncbi:MAG: pyruvate kinase [Candidatus Moraniibacteriota bacterium]|nr:MAG: pyruvate kinase [Candidatus Moranbacteria bacterium]